MRRLLTTMACGVAATAVMTVAMKTMFRRLPWYQRYPLPPRLITSRVLHRFGIGWMFRERHKRALTLANHFGYGAAAGAVYTPVSYLAVSPLASGALFGIAVWAASYVGWLPSANILPHPRFTPRRRNGLMIAAHVVWGAALATLAHAAAAQPVSSASPETGALASLRRWQIVQNRLRV
jgi:hypothetical protein